MTKNCQTNLWKLEMPPPWRFQLIEGCIEITQPDGVGAIHISGARKRIGSVSEDDLKGSAAKELPEGEELDEVSLGEFTGVGSSYADWHTDTFWKKWWVGCGSVMLYVTYHCDQGDEDHELPEAEELLARLEPASAG